jgi:hypothetical protein
VELAKQLSRIMEIPGEDMGKRARWMDRKDPSVYDL